MASFYEISAPRETLKIFFVLLQNFEFLLLLLRDYDDRAGVRFEIFDYDKTINNEAKILTILIIATSRPTNFN